jgi:hypothetical protein
MENSINFSHFVLSSVEDSTSYDYIKELGLSDSEIIHLFFEDYLSKWKYFCRNGDIYFIYQDEIYKPKSIYNRGCSTSDSKNGLKHIHAFIDYSSVNKISGSGFINGSKPLQAAHTIIPSIQKLGLKNVKYPNTVIVKGPKSLLERVASSIPKYIVKSLSYVRSKVVDQDVIKTWNHFDFFYAPTMFQEAIYGLNIRSHFTHGADYPVEIHDHDELDYRYSDQDINLKKHIFSKSIPAFTKEVASREQNQLMGVDFIISNKKYYCLEANPTPGWSFFDIFNSEIAQKIWRYSNE